MAGNEVRITVTSRDRSKAGFQSARKNADQLGTSTRRIGEIAAGILASGVFERIASAAKRAFTDTIVAASNLNESINAAQVTFGAAAEDVLAIGENSAQSLGMSRREFNEAAVRFSAFAETIAGEGGNISGVVEEVTQRSADFASVMNLDVAEAMRLFQSGLAGESEPLRRYGIDVSAAAVETEAYASGIAEAGAELTEAEKIQARYNLIMGQTADTAGDFANTSDDLANAQRILSAEVEDTQASMGQAMLPVLAAVAGFLTDVLRGFQQLPGPVQATALTLAAVTTAAGAAAGALRVLGVSAAAVKAALGPIGIALLAGGAIIAGLAALGQNAKTSKEELQGLTDAVEENNRELAAQELETLGVLEAARELGLAIPDVVDAFTEGGDAAEAYRQRLREIFEDNSIELASGAGRAAINDMGRTAEAQLQIFADFEAGVIDAAEAERRIAKATGEADAALRTHEEAVEAAEQAYSEARSALDEYLEEISSAVDPLAGYQAQQERVAEAQERVNELEEEGKTDSEEYTQAVTDLWREQEKLDAVTLDAGTQIDGMRQRLEKARSEGRLSEQQYRNQKAALDELEAQAQDTSGRYDVSVQLLGVRLAEIELDHLTRARTVPIVGQVTGVRGGAQLSAHGGITGARGMQGGGQAGARSRIVVGERVPEVLEVPPGSRVIPSVDQATDRNQLAPSGAQHVVVELHLEGAEDAFVEALRKALRVRGESLAVAS